MDPDRAIYRTAHSAYEFLSLTLLTKQTRFVTAWAGEQLLGSPIPKPRLCLITSLTMNGPPPAKIPDEFLLGLQSMSSWGPRNASRRPWKDWWTRE